MPAVYIRTTDCLPQSMCLLKHKNPSLNITEVESEFMTFQWSSVSTLSSVKEKTSDLTSDSTEYQWSWWVSIADVQLLSAAQCWSSMPSHQEHVCLEAPPEATPATTGSWSNHLLGFGWKCQILLMAAGEWKAHVFPLISENGQKPS